MLAPVVALIILALIFDFINGFHDAANSIATVVSTRVLSPMIAVFWAAFFNFIAAFGGGVKVANTMGKGIIQFDLLKAQGTHIVLAVIFASLLGAIVWDLITWWWGLPSSSSHALAGRLIGAALARVGLGTAAGGWRIIRTMGHNLPKLQPIGGFCAETGGGVTILAIARLGIPVSTTHTITGAIVGVGATKGTRAVRWGVAGRILWAWILTIPASAAVAAAAFVVVQMFSGR